MLFLKKNLFSNFIYLYLFFNNMNGLSVKYINEISKKQRCHNKVKYNIIAIKIII